MIYSLCVILHVLFSHKMLPWQSATLFSDITTEVCMAACCCHHTHYNLLALYVIMKQSKSVHAVHLRCTKPRHVPVTTQTVLHLHNNEVVDKHNETWNGSLWNLKRIIAHTSEFIRKLYFLGHCHCHHKMYRTWLVCTIDCHLNCYLFH